MKYEPSVAATTIVYIPDGAALPSEDVRFHCADVDVGYRVVTTLPRASRIVTDVAMVLPVLMVTVPEAGFGYALMPTEYASVTDAAISQVPVATTVVLPASADVMSKSAVYDPGLTGLNSAHTSAVLPAETVSGNVVVIPNCAALVPRR